MIVPQIGASLKFGRQINLPLLQSSKKQINSSPLRYHIDFRWIKWRIDRTFTKVWQFNLKTSTSSIGPNLFETDSFVFWTTHIYAP